MRAQYLFSLAAVLGTVGIFAWRPSAPTPVTSNRDEGGLLVRVTQHAPPHSFEQLPVPSLRHPRTDVFVMPKSYLRSRLCAGDDAILAATQARLLITPGEGPAFGRVVDRCGSDSPLCPRAEAALAEDAGLSNDELRFFAESLLGCDRHRFAELRTDRRFPLELRERAWMFVADAGGWSPELDALIDEHLAASDKSTDIFGLTNVLNVRGDCPELLAGAERVMDRVPYAAKLLAAAEAESVRERALKLGYDAGVTAEMAIDQRERLATCALQGDQYERGDCLDRLAQLDWEMARVVAQRMENESDWTGVLRAFETREAFHEFARTFGATPEPDGGYSPLLLLGDMEPESVAFLYTEDGLGTDELAAQWATLAPELKGVFFFESADGAEGVLLSGRLGDGLFEVSARADKTTTDPRAALALLNVMVSESGTAKRFFLTKSNSMARARFAEPERVKKLAELGIIELLAPDEARSLEE